MDSFEYKPIDLDQPTFRLLRLRSGCAPIIECEIFHAWLDHDDLIPFEALSYTWGSSEKAASVLVDGKELGVTKNLYLALQHLRRPEVDRILWIDALCINQDDLLERGHQVQHMGYIYSQADQVVIWLGLATEETDVLMVSLKRLEEASARCACRNWKIEDERWVNLWSSVQPMLRVQYWGLLSRQRTGLQYLLAQPWFERVWILQEVANAKRAVICSGAKYVSARIFALAPLLLNIFPNPQCKAVLDIMPGPSRESSWWSRRRDLYTLLVKFHRSKASDPRDNLYALLGMCTDVQDSYDLRIDYTKSYLEVVDRIASFLFFRKSLGNTSPREILLPGTVFGNTSDRPEDFVCCTIPELVSCITHLSSMFSQIQLTLLPATYLFAKQEDVIVTEELVAEAAACIFIRMEVIGLLLNHAGPDIEITPSLVSAAARRPVNGAELTNFLIERGWSGIEITEGMFRSAAENKQCGAEVTKVLREHQKFNVETERPVFVAERRNKQREKELMALLHKYQSATEMEAVVLGSKVPVNLLQSLLHLPVECLKYNSDLVIAVVRTMGAGHTSILLERLENGIQITERIFEAVGNNKERGEEVMIPLLQQEVPGLDVVESPELFNKIVEKAVLSKYWSEKVLHVLQSTMGSRVQITYDLLKWAARTESHAVERLGYVVKAQRIKIEVLEEIGERILKEGESLDSGYKTTVANLRDLSRKKSFYS